MGEEGGVGFYHSWVVGEGQGQVAFGGEEAEGVVVGDLSLDHCVFFFRFDDGTEKKLCVFFGHYCGWDIFQEMEKEREIWEVGLRAQGHVN